MTLSRHKKAGTIDQQVNVPAFLFSFRLQYSGHTNQDVLSMSKLLSQPAIEELRYLLSKEITPSIVEEMTDEEISYIGFFLLEVFVQGLYIRNKS